MKKKIKMKAKEKKEVIKEIIPEIKKKSGMTQYKYFGTGRKRVLGQVVQNPGDIVEIPTDRNFRHQLFVPLTNKRREVKRKTF